jgi:hypothetical protein
VSAGRLRWTAAYVLVIAAFLTAVSRYYHPPYGFTAFIEFPAAAHEGELSAVRDASHYDSSSPGYDGQFYAELAVDPFVRDPAIDRALDNPPYRARRILFSWTAYALGLGRPAWVLQAYAVQNVLAWLILAWVLCRWMPPRDARSFALWTGCLLAPGFLASVRYALPDGPSALIVALGVAAAERGRPILAAIGVGLAGLARETNLLAASALAPFLRRSPRSWALVGACLILCALPLAIWLDYLRSIYRSRVFENSGHLTVPLSGIVWKLGRMADDWRGAGVSLPAAATFTAVFGLFVQAGCVVWAIGRAERRTPWVFVGASYVVLAALMHHVVWDGAPGAFTRVLLPLTIGANVVLAATPRPAWWAIAGANLALAPAVLLFVS